MLSRVQDIKNINVKGKRVLVRCDFNVPFTQEGDIADDLRIKQSLPTIRYLLDKKAKVILVTHLDKPVETGSMKDKKRNGIFSRLFSGTQDPILPIKEKLSLLLEQDVKFYPDCIGAGVKKKISRLKEGEIILLQNVRIYEEEKKNSEEFAGELASLAEIYVNDAFSVSHRKHASVVGIPRILPSVAGLLMQKEINILQKIKEGTKRPMVAIIGGAKIESKIVAIRYFLEVADHILLGGKIANSVLIVRKQVLNAPWPEKEVVQAVEKADFTSPKIHLPVDVKASPDFEGDTYVRDTAVGQVRRDENILDIGPETIKLYKEIISQAGSVIWAGPLGFFEKEKFSTGTKEIGEAVAWNHRALKVVGGGDTSSALKKFSILDKMDHVSCGGGALLSFVSEGEMPGLTALENKA